MILLKLNYEMLLRGENLNFLKKNLKGKVAMAAKVSVILIYLMMNRLELLLSAGSHVLCVELLVFAPSDGQE